MPKRDSVSLGVSKNSVYAMLPLVMWVYGQTKDLRIEGMEEQNS